MIGALWPRLRWRAGPHADLRHLPVSLDLRAISLVEGLRAALAVGTVMLVAEWLDRPDLSEVALGALLTCISDSGGPVARRVPTLLAFAVIGSALTAGFSLLRPFGLAVVVPLATLCIMLFGFARIWGTTAMQAGNLLAVVTVLSLDHADSPAEALWHGLLFGAGSLWALALTIFLWRLRLYRPTRRSLADVFKRQAALVADLQPMLEGADPAIWAAHARAHRRHVRDGLETARTLVLDTLRIRGGATLRAHQAVIQLEAADQLFGVLIALSDVLEHADAETRDAARRVLPALRLLLAAVSDATALDEPPDDPAAAAMEAQLMEVVAGLEATPALAGLAKAALDRLRVALLLTTPEGLVSGQVGSEGGPTIRDQVIGPIRGNLVWTSANLRHAVRAGAVGLPALAITLQLGHTYAHWLTITLILTLQPFFALTWQKALERCGGTVLGALIAAAIGLIVQGPMQTAVVLIPLMIAAFALRAVSFGLFMACLTPVVVLLSDLGRPGDGELAIALARAAYSLLGGALAVAGGLLLWPIWEPIRLRAALDEALRRHAHFADRELAALATPNEVSPAELDIARRAAGVASNALETALNRALQEPRQESAREADIALAVDAALRRLAGRLTVLQHDPRQAGSDSAGLTAWRTWVASAFHALLNGAPLPEDAPPDAGHPALGRIARQIILIGGAMSATRRPE